MYGHVVASNPIGEVYVSPLATTMEEIKQSYPSLAVSLPRPAPMIQNLLPHLDAAKADKLSGYYLDYIARVAPEPNPASTFT